MGPQDSVFLDCDSDAGWGATELVQSTQMTDKARRSERTFPKARRSLYSLPSDQRDRRKGGERSPQLSHQRKALQFKFKSKTPPPLQDPSPPLSHH